MKLSLLPPGATAEIINVESPRLWELGFMPGRRVCCLYAAPFGFPRAYRVEGLTLALRRSEAEQVEVKRDV